MKNSVYGSPDLDAQAEAGARPLRGKTILLSAIFPIPSKRSLLLSSSILEEAKELAGEKSLKVFHQEEAARPGNRESPLWSKMPAFMLLVAFFQKSTTAMSNGFL